MDSDETSGYLAERFDLAAWRDRTTLDENLFLWHFLLAGGELPGWRLERRQQADLAPGRRLLHTVWRRSDGGAGGLRLDLVECPSRAEAHDTLVELLGQFQLPGLERSEADLGDIAFAAATGSTLAFARGNLVVALAPAEGECPEAPEVAGTLDRRLIEKPPGAAEVELVDLATPGLAAAAETLEIGAEVPLPLRTPQLAAAQPERPLTLKIFSPSGEICERYGGLTYRPQRSGVQEVTLYALRPEDGRPEVQRLELGRVSSSPSVD